MTAFVKVTNWATLCTMQMSAIGNPLRVDMRPWRLNNVLISIGTVLRCHAVLPSVAIYGTLCILIASMSISQCQSVRRQPKYGKTFKRDAGDWPHTNAIPAIFVCISSCVIMCLKSEYPSAIDLFCSLILPSSLLACCEKSVQVFGSGSFMPSSRYLDTRQSLRNAKAKPMKAEQSIERRVHTMGKIA